MQKVCSGEELPSGDATVGAIFMINVLHHINDVSRFFTEAGRVPGESGYDCDDRVIYFSPFSRFLYTYIHHEPFDEHADSWQLSPSER